jgi:ACS family hexuronate transporter-like MFS transporter
MNRRALLTACGVGFAFSANYTNHGPMLPVLREHFALSQGSAGLITTAIFLTHALMQVPGGRLADRFGSLRTLIIALAWVALANTGLGLCTSFSQLLFFKAMAGLGTGTCFAAGARYTVATFHGPALNLAQGFYGGSILLGAGFVIFAVPQLQDLLGWRGAFLGCAVIALALCLHCLWGAPRPEAMTAPPARFAQMLSHRELWLLGMVQMATFGLMIVVGSWITTLLRTTLGMQLKAAGLLGSLVLLLGIVTRPFGGWLAHRVRLRPLAGASLVLNAAACAALAASHSFLVMFAAIASLALGCGVPYAACFNRAAALFPGRAGVAIGLVNMIGIVMILAGAPAVGWVADATGSFRTSFIALGVFTFLAASSVPFLPEDSNNPT